MLSDDPTRPFTNPCPPDHRRQPIHHQPLHRPPLPDRHLEDWLEHCGYQPQAQPQTQMRQLNDAMLRRKAALWADHLSDVTDPVMRKMAAMHRALVLRTETPADRRRREAICPTCGGQR